MENKGAFVNWNSLDCRGMDSKRTSDSINELSSSTLCKEFFECPFHSDESLDGISWLNVENTAVVNIEFEDILDSEVSVLSTEVLLDWTIIFLSIVPLVELNNLSILNNVSTFSWWVVDSDSHTTVLYFAYYLEDLFGWWTTCVFNVINTSWCSINYRLIPWHVYLSSIEPIPNMVHMTVQLVLHSSSLQHHINWWDCSIPSIFV